MAAFVSCQLGRALELQLACVAGIRAFPRVDSLMQLSLAEGEEGLLTVSTGEWPLSCVDKVVSGEGVGFGEALPAVSAGVGAGPGVRDDVLLLCFLALKALPALRAGVRPVVHV